MNIKTIQVSEVKFCIRTNNKEKFPAILYFKDFETSEEYRIKGEMNLEQIKTYYKIFKRVLEEGGVND